MAGSAYHLAKSASLLAALAIVICACRSQKGPSGHYQSTQLSVEQVADKVYRHVSYLDIPGYGKFPCNGMVVIDKGEALVFDSPVNDAAAAELLTWIQQAQRAKITAVVANHFHNDCLGGLNAFREQGIPSYGSAATIRLAKAIGNPVPDRSFEAELQLSAGTVRTLTVFPGPGHTEDNVVTYVPHAQTLFGGCLLKAEGAGKGNLADANVAEWPVTVQSVQARFPDLKVVIPGHGEPGGPELLDYTIQLFSR